MHVKDQTLAVLDALNRRDFETFMASFSEEAILDLPDGIRVVGRTSFRDTLSAYVLRHELSLADFVVMTDEAGFRVAVEVTLKGRDRREVDAAAADAATPYSLPAVVVLERGDEGFTRFSLFAGVQP